MSPRWSPDEDRMLRRLYVGGLPLRAIAERIGRSEDAVAERRRTLKMPARARQRPWSPHEDAVVRDGYESGLTCEKIATELTGRTPTAVAARASKLGLATYARTWTPREDRRLRQLACDGIELERAARLLGRTPEALRARARKLGIAPPRSPRSGRSARRWTPREDEWLQLHGALNPAALAELLDRSPQAITQRLRQLGLRQGSERSPHHPAPTRGGLTPGQRLTVARELRAGGAGRRLAVARRLGIAPAELRLQKRRASAG